MSSCCIFAIRASTTGSFRTSGGSLEALRESSALWPQRVQEVVAEAQKDLQLRTQVKRVAEEVAWRASVVAVAPEMCPAVAAPHRCTLAVPAEELGPVLVVWVVHPLSGL